MVELHLANQVGPRQSNCQSFHKNRCYATNQLHQYFYEGIGFFKEHNPSSVLIKILDF